MQSIYFGLENLVCTFGQEKIDRLYVYNIGFYFGLLKWNVVNSLFRCIIQMHNKLLARSINKGSLKYLRLHNAKY